ncbi:MAG: hypothetical protein QXN40_07805, partial [Candidatus Bathyarchaeia archaeon]
PLPASSTPHISIFAYRPILLKISLAITLGSSSLLLYVTAIMSPLLLAQWLSYLSSAGPLEICVFYPFLEPSSVKAAGLRTLLS